jgi:hypothetical protein
MFSVNSVSQTLYLPAENYLICNSGIRMENNLYSLYVDSICKIKGVRINMM